MSKLGKALNNIGFKTRTINNKSSSIKISSKEIHLALITNLYFAGYFQDQKIWQAINLIGYHKNSFNSTCNWNKDPQLAFLLMYRVIEKSGASQPNPQIFRAKYLLKNLFLESIFDIEDIEDFIVYLTCQNAFSRILNQERNEISTQDWMKKYHNQYIENADLIGLISNIEPSLKSYDLSLIMGAGRYRCISRIKNLKEIYDSGIDIGQVILLSGNRELWLEIDNINDINEAKNYILNLAKKQNIKINEDNPFIIRHTIGRNSRTYLNYREGEKKKLTETMMMQEIYQEIFDNNDVIKIDDTRHNKNRPTTESTVQNFVRNSGISGSKNSNNKILIISNQPYVERQKLTTIRVFNKIIGLKNTKKIIFDGIGEEANTQKAISHINSEFAALMAERFWQYTNKNKQLKKRKRSPQKMIFPTNTQSSSLIPPIPDHK